MKGMDFMIFVNLNFVIKKFPYGGWFNFFFFFNLCNMQEELNYY